MTSSITPGSEVLSDSEAHAPMLDLPAITIAAYFHPSTLSATFDLNQVAEGVFVWDSADAQLLQRLQALALDVAHVQIEQAHTDTSDFLIALQGRIDLEIDISFDAEIPETAWHFCLMAAHNALIGATTAASVDDAVEPSTTLALPLVSLRGELIQAAAKGTFARELVDAGVFLCDEDWPDGMLNLQQAAEAVADSLALNGSVRAEDFVRALHKRIDVDITAHLEADPPGLDALVFLMAAHNALNSLLAHALVPSPFKADEWSGSQADEPAAPVDESQTVALYPRGDEPVLLTADEQQVTGLVRLALEMMESFYGTLELPLRERLNTLYAKPLVSVEALKDIVEDSKKLVSDALTELAGYVVDVRSIKIHTARTDKPAVSGQLWAWLSQGTPLQLAPPQFSRDAYDFVMNSWLTLDDAPFNKSDGSAVTVNEVIGIGRKLDIGQVIAQKCDRWGGEGDVADAIIQEAQADFEITLLNALKTNQITLQQYQHLLGSTGVSVPGYTDGSVLPYGNQHMRIEAHDVPVFGLRTRNGHYIYAATAPEGRLFTADEDSGRSAATVFIEAFRANLWGTRLQRDGWSWSLLGPAAQQAVNAKLPQPLPHQPSKSRPATAYWTGRGVYASKADHDRKASEVNLTAPYAVRQSTAVHALEVTRPSWRPAFITALATTRRAFLANQVKEQFTPNQHSSLAHALRIGSEFVAFVLDVLLIAVPGKVKLPGRAFLFKVMFLKQLAIDLPTSLVQSKWDEAGEVLIDFFETVLEMGATRKAGSLARSRLNKLSRALLPAQQGDTGHASGAPIQPETTLRGMLPPVLQALKDSELSDVLRQSGVSASELSAMKANQAPMSMELAVEASLAMNRVLRAQVKLMLDTPRYRELPSRVEWPVVGLLSHHLDICITVLGPDGRSLRRFEPVSGNVVPGSARQKPEVVLTRFGAWHFSANTENQNGAISNSLFYYVQPAPNGARLGDRVAQADRLKEGVAKLLFTPDIERAFANAIHHGTRPRANVQAEEGTLLAVTVEGKDTVDPGKLSGAPTRWVSEESERCVPDANGVENLNKARLQNDLALLNGGLALSASPALTQNAESLYLSGLMDVFNGIPALGEAVAVRVIVAGKTVAVWGNEHASQVLVLDRRGGADTHHYMGRLEGHDAVAPGAHSTNPLSELVLRLMNDDARNKLGIDITDPHRLTKSVMERVLSVRTHSTAQGSLIGIDVTSHSGLSNYVQSVTLTVSPTSDGLIRQDSKVWLEWGHGALEVRAQGDAWRVFSAAGGAGPLMLRSYAEWRILQEPVAALDRFEGAQVTDAAVLAKLDEMQRREPLARVYHLWADGSTGGGSYIAFSGSSRTYYRVRPAETGADELEVVRPDGSGGGVWLRQGPSGAWDPAPRLLGGALGDEHIVVWRPWGSPTPLPLQGGFGIQNSMYESRVSAQAVSRRAHNPFFPFFAPSGLEDYYSNRLFISSAALKDKSSTANIAAKVEVFSRQWQMPLDITALSFFRMPDDVSSEAFHVNGALIANLVLKQVGNQPVIRRILEPMAGSGFYANYVRAVGYTGALQVNDSNPLSYLTKRLIVEQPDRVKHYIGNIKANLVALAYEGAAMRFDSNRLKIQFATAGQAEVFIESEAASRIREDIKNYFQYLIDTHFVMTPVGVGVHPTLPDSEARAYLAAALYLMQHNSEHNAVVSVDTEGALNLALSTVTRDDNVVSLLPNGIANIDHLNYLSHIHSAQDKETIFTDYDGWGMFDPIEGTIKDGDLAILSGHFGNVKISEPRFIGKVRDHVVPFIELGGRVVIIDSYSNYKADELSALGLQVFEIRTQSKGYLLAVNTQVVTDVGLAVN